MTGKGLRDTSSLSESQRRIVKNKRIASLFKKAQEFKPARHYSGYLSFMKRQPLISSILGDIEGAFLRFFVRVTVILWFQTLGVLPTAVVAPHVDVILTPDFALRPVDGSVLANDIVNCTVKFFTDRLLDRRKDNGKLTHWNRFMTSLRGSFKNEKRMNFERISLLWFNEMERLLMNPNISKEDNRVDTMETKVIRNDGRKVEIKIEGEVGTGSTKKVYAGDRTRDLAILRSTATPTWLPLRRTLPDVQFDPRSFICTVWTEFFYMYEFGPRSFNIYEFGPRNFGDFLRLPLGSVF
ncbi:hypothetical protein RND71_038546 [Anisodus tanguticus]|uniref:Uncharacterized protein n=1 Tax=Anisodus tanguticus TaxID=243964 RepID=A0AAE1UZK2_9SOLA|nr:hypothetical protein RND71_038546 [Anisodus tanguticus]